MSKEKEYREELFKLMRENPELPIVPMVDSEIVADDGYCRWRGAWGGSYIGEYLIGEERIFFREDDDPYEVDKVLTEKCDDYDENTTDEEAAKAYAELPWIKAIIVNIDLPGQEETLPTKYLEALEAHGWAVSSYTDDGRVELEKYSPAGEDFIMCVEVENFPDAVMEYYEDFDVDEHIEMWVEARLNGTSGVPSTRRLAEDAEAIDEMLKELAYALAEV